MENKAKYLEEIVNETRKNVETFKKIRIPPRILEKQIQESIPVVSLKKSILLGTGVIMEYKRRSPLKGYLNMNVESEYVCKYYFEAGASGVSILTEERFFAGRCSDLRRAKSLYPAYPFLRKDFIIDEYQILETRSIGADAILLIANILSPQEVKKFATLSKELHLEVLLEIHTELELLKCLHMGIENLIDIIGVNNRNLDTMEIDIDNSKKLSDTIPPLFCKISESGIHSHKIIQDLKKNYGYHGFLIGERFMKEPDPGIEALLFMRHE